MYAAAVSSLSPAPTDIRSLYLNVATIAALPTKCSRHNTPSRAHLTLSELCELWTPDSLPLSLWRICWIRASSCDSSALLAQWSIVSATWEKEVFSCDQSSHSTFSSRCSPSLRTRMKSSCSSLLDPARFRSREWQVLQKEFESKCANFCGWRSYVQVVQQKYGVAFQVSANDDGEK